MKWLIKAPDNTGLAKFSMDEVVDIMEKWEDYVEATLPNENEVAREANNQKNLDTRIAFRNGAEFMRTHRIRR